MNDHANIVREALRRVHCVDDHGYVHAGSDSEALAALDALVAERDRVLGAYHRENDGRQAAEAEVARLREALTDQCEMNEQALKELRQLHKEWPLMTEQTNFDGEPLIVEVLRGVIDDLDTGPSRAALGDDA